MVAEVGRCFSGALEGRQILSARGYIDKGWGGPSKPDPPSSPEESPTLSHVRRGDVGLGIRMTTPLTHM